MPAMEKISQKYADSDVQIWGICIDLCSENGDVLEIPNAVRSEEQWDTLVQEVMKKYCNKY